MFGPMATFNKPITTLTFLPKLPTEVFSLSKLRISGREFVSKKLVFSEKRRRSPNIMAESITTQFRGSSGDEGIGALEQQVFIDGSSEFHQNFGAGGLESTLNRVSKWLVTALFCTVILSRHDTKALWLVLGANLNGGLSIILKQILKQERPSSTFKSDPGMPSSHSQSIFFIAFMTNLSMMELLGLNGLTTTLAGILFAFGSYLSWLRVSQRFHTISQVIVGALVGSIFFIFWFWLWDAIMQEAFNSYLWFRVIVVLVGAGMSLGFVLNTLRHKK